MYFSNIAVLANMSSAEKIQRRTKGKNLEYEYQTTFLKNITSVAFR